MLSAVLAVIAAYLAITSILSGQMQNLEYAAVAVLAVAFVLRILNNWRQGLYLFLGWLLFEDLLRKFLGNNMAIYFGKDLLVLVVYISFLGALRRKQIQTFRPPFLLPFALFFWFGVLQVFNPASTSYLYGALGLQLYFYYVPLIFVGYALADSEAEMRKLFLISLGLAFIVIGLGAMQAVLGHTFLNPANPGEDIRELSTSYRPTSVSGVSAYRPTSVFVSAGRFATYSILMWIVAFGVCGYLLLRSRRGRFLAFGTLGVITAAIALSASRGALLWTGGSALVCTAAFLWGAPWREGGALRVIRAIQRAFFLGGVALLLLLVVYPEALSSRVSFYTESLSPGSPTSDLLYRTRDYPLKNLELAFQHPRWPYGYGIGTASLGTQYVARIFRLPSPTIGVESGYGTLIVELGIVGLALWIVWTLALAITGWRVVKRLRGSPWFPLGFAIWWFAVLLLIPITYTGLNSYQDFVINANLWLLLGVFFRLPDVARSAQLAAAGATNTRMQGTR